ncbi:hypothetical protein PG985_014586 [Apiospora marii]|uniref:F-box domain-containing protein n=1 Tax=Apiospora marii TaxID=335849 RepID=A0ABR1R4W3_9PEZI
MSSLLDLPDELLLIIQDHLTTRRDRFAFGSVNKSLYKAFGGTVVYEQDVAEERDFDEARLRLEQIPSVHDLVLFNRQDLESGWAEAMPAKFSWAEGVVAARVEEGGQETDTQELFGFIKKCVERWGPRMLCFTNPALWGMVSEDMEGLPPLPDSQRRQGRTLTYRAIRYCNDMAVLEQVFDIYLETYPAAIQGMKDGQLDRLPEPAPEAESDFELPESLEFAQDYPVYLAAFHNRVDALDLLHKKGVNINLVKTDLALQNDHSWTRFVHRLRSDDTDVHWASDPVDGLVHHPDLWTWLRVQSYRREERESGFPEDVCVWLVEHNLGFSDERLSLGLRDLRQAAMNNHARLVAAMLKLFQARLGPGDEYRDALTMALHSAAVAPLGRFGQWKPPRSPPLENHIDVFQVLLEAGATLRQDPDREWDWGMLTSAVELFPADATWLLRRQLAEGVTDHRDLRAALGRVIECRDDQYYSDRKRAKEDLEFLAAVYPANAHLACDPGRVATPQGREEALLELLGQVVREVHHECDGPFCKDVALYLEGVVGREHIDEILGRGEMPLRGRRERR